LQIGGKEVGRWTKVLGGSFLVRPAMADATCSLV